MFTPNQLSWVLCAALLAALTSCSRDGGASAEPAGNNPAAGQAGLGEPVPVIDQVNVPTADEAYDAARAEIDETNADEELQRLLEEIEGKN